MFIIGLEVMRLDVKIQVTDKAVILLASTVKVSASDIFYVV